MVRRNQNGVTLIELLLTLTILTIVGAIIWGTLVQGSKYSNNAVTKNQMQQEANIIISRLTKIHQISESYNINSSGCKVTVVYKEKNNIENTETFENQRLCISTSTIDNIKPNIRDVPLTIKIKDNNSNNRVSIETVLSRLKGGGLDEEEIK